LLYALFDGTEWRLTYLSQAGTRLYETQADYTGLGALDPDNPEVIYISTPYDTYHTAQNFETAIVGLIE
jgi:hypothetical protein